MEFWKCPVISRWSCFSRYDHYFIGRTQWILYIRIQKPFRLVIQSTFKIVWRKRFIIIIDFTGTQRWIERIEAATKRFPFSRRKIVGRFTYRSLVKFWSWKRDYEWTLRVDFQALIDPLIWKNTEHISSIRLYSNRLQSSFYFYTDSPPMFLWVYIAEQ